MGTGDLLRLAVFRFYCFTFISFSLAFTLINAIIYFLFPFDRLLSDNPISSAGTRLFSISNQDLFM